MKGENFSLITAKVVGSANEDTWAQAINLTNLAAVIALFGNDDPTLGRNLVTFLEGEGPKLEEKNLAELFGLTKKLKNQVPHKTHLSLIIAFPVGGVLYLVSSGGAAYLRRSGKLVKIVEGEEKASGFLQDGDILILGSEQFFRTVDLHFLSDNSDHLSPEEIAEQLVPQISAVENNAGCAGLVILFQKKTEEWAEEETEAEVQKGEGPIEEKKNRLLTVWQSALARIPGKLKFPKMPRPELPISLNLPSEEKTGRGKKTLLTAALLLVLLLAGSIFLGLDKTHKNEQAKKFTDFYQDAAYKYEEGKGLLGLNDTLARERLSEAKKQLEEMKKNSSFDKSQEKKIKELESKISESLVALSHIYKLDKLSLFWETSLIKEGSGADQLAIFEDQIAILDRKNRYVYLLSAKTKAVSPFEGKDWADEAKLISLHGDNIYVFTAAGIYSLNTRNKKNQLIIKKDEAWGDIVFLNAYAGNLYLLDRKGNPEPSTGQIWKYIGMESGFSERRPYLVSDIKPDFSGVREMAIDGSIWVLLSGEILKFANGRPDNFLISGLEDNFGHPRAIFTNEKSRNLYLLDQENKRVLMIGKDGAYQAQYEAEEIGQAQDLVVSEEEKKIFLLIGNKIYYIEIKS